MNLDDIYFNDKNSSSSKIDENSIFRSKRDEMKQGTFILFHTQKMHSLHFIVSCIFLSIGSIDIFVFGLYSHQPFKTRFNINARNFLLKSASNNNNNNNQLYIPNEVELCDKLENGCVLVSQPDEFSHFLVKSVVLLFDYGGLEKPSLGVILERPTAFSLGETAPGMTTFEANTLYMGGENGNDTAMLFHKYNLGGNSKYIGNGIYSGGLKEAKEIVQSRNAHPKDFKFIFNYNTWVKGQLDNDVKTGRWNVLRCPPDFIIREDDSLSLWTRCRRSLRGLRKDAASDTLSEDEDD